MSDEKPIPLAENWRVQRLLERLRQGPADTIQLQSDLPFPHVARQVWEMRHWYGMTVKTGRRANRVAVYTLVQEAPRLPVQMPALRCRFCAGSGCLACTPAMSA